MNKEERKSRVLNAWANTNEQAKWNWSQQYGIINVTQRWIWLWETNKQVTHEIMKIASIKHQQTDNSTKQLKETKPTS